jgi:hypothetical protein
LSGSLFLGFEAVLDCRVWEVEAANPANSLCFPFDADHDSVVHDAAEEHKTTGSNDLFPARLDQIINMKHELVLLAAKVDWDWIDGEIALLYGGEEWPARDRDPRHDRTAAG